MFPDLTGFIALLSTPMYPTAMALTLATDLDDKAVFTRRNVRDRWHFPAYAMWHAVMNFIANGTMS